VNLTFTLATPGPPQNTALSTSHSFLRYLKFGVGSEFCGAAFFATCVVFSNAQIDLRPATLDISDAAVIAGKPLVSASALRTEGQLMVLNSPPVGQGEGKAGFCY